MERIKNLLDRKKRSRDLGGEVESIALRFLEGRGMRLIGRNYQCRAGEIDLIMEESGTLVFVEVRFRKTSIFGSALESVDARKRSRIINCASHYLTTKKISSPARFDVVAISPCGEELGVTWVPDAFQI